VELLRAYGVRAVAGRAAGSLIRRADEWYDGMRHPRGLPDAGDGRRTIVIADAHVPFTDRDAGSRRIASVAGMLIEQGWRVLFASLDARAYQPYARALREAGVEIVTGFSMQRLDELARRKVRVDVAWLCRPQSAQLFTSAFRTRFGAAVLFDTVDLHYVRLQREEAVFGRATGWQTMRAQELELARAADATIVTSATEADLLRDAGIANVAVVPVIERLAAAGQPGWEDRSGVAFLGNYAHAPNADAARWLCKQIMPIVWQRQPSLPVTIAGADPTREVRALARGNVRVTGYVRDPSAMLAKARIFAAPLRFGAGVKGKIVLALAHAMPIVTTPIGAEGIFEPGDRAAIACDAETFAAQILRLHDDRAAWEAASRDARNVAHRFTPDATRAEILRVVGDYPSRDTGSS
jgi:hypothetical protein